jgi:hypothetical protein
VLVCDFDGAVRGIDNSGDLVAASPQRRMIWAALAI